MLRSKAAADDWRRGKASPLPKEDCPGGRPEKAGGSGSCLMLFSSLGEIFGLQATGLDCDLVGVTSSPSDSSDTVMETT